MADMGHDRALDRSLEAVRSRICNAFLIAFSVITIPLLASSLYRALSIGWQPVMWLHIVFTLAFWFITLFRERLPYAFRAGYILFVLIVAGLAGIWQFNLLAAAIALLVMAPPLATVLFGLRVGLLALGAVILPSVAIGMASVLGHRLPSFDVAEYLTRSSSWVTAILAWIFTGAASLLAFNVLNGFLVETLEKTRRQARALGESEHDYRNILKNMTDTFYRADREGRLVMASPSARDLVGYSPDELIGKKLADFYVDPGQRAAMLELLDKGDGVVRNFEAEIYGRDGGRRCVSTNTHYWCDSDGNVLGVEGLIRDVTDYKVTEEALRRSQKMEAIGQLTGGVAHDFNNLLGVMLGNTELLEMKLRDNPDYVKYTLQLRSAIERAATLTQRLLAFSRKQQLSPKPTDVGQQIRNLEDMLRPMLGETIDLHIDIAAELEPALIDAGQLDHALVNLAINARDAMPTGGKLTIAARNVHRDLANVGDQDALGPGRYVEVSVSDTGFGMDPEDVENSFEPFFTTKDVGKGSGLGLSMVYGFVKQSGGHVAIESKPGLGTRITLDLPCYEGELGERAANEDVVGVPSGPGRILIVEDDPAVRAVPAAVLREQGYEVIEAGNGRQAIDYLEGGRDVDLLFTDVVLPDGMSGVEVANAAVRLCPDIRVLYTTGYPDNHLPPGERLEIVSKPYHVGELLTKIRDLLKDRDG